MAYNVYIVFIKGYPNKMLFSRSSGENDSKELKEQWNSPE